MLMCGGACVCVCVCVCVYMCVCVWGGGGALRIVFTDKILHFANTFIIIN